MILDAIAFQGTMDFKVIQGRQTAAGYIVMLERTSLLIEGPHLCGNYWIFQQENAAIHNAHRTKDVFMTSKVIILCHQASSADMNTIEFFYM